MLAKSIIPLILIGCSALAAEQPLAAPTAAPKYLYPQRPLAPQKAELALVFIGGLGDEISGIIEYTARRLPTIATTEARAYYHWNAGCLADVEQRAHVVAQHVAAFRQQNPQADVVLIGHSMGAGTALLAAQFIPTPAQGQGRILLVTLDPADHSVSPTRPASVHWWGNCYVVHSQSGHDFIAELGGRWRHCPAANLNIRFNGLRTDEFGFEFIHDNALSLLLSHRGTPPQSIYDTLVEMLKK